MIRIRRAEDRGHADHGWLDTRHSFSFASYHDTEHMRFRALRVMNEDIIAPGAGFGTHPHHDMEIITYVLSGALEHRDSMGNGEVLRAREFQRMSAGTGITHSEFNPSESEPAHLYQIWLLPDRRGMEPSYEQKRFPRQEQLNRLRLVASPDAANGSLLIHLDARIFLASIEPGREITHELKSNRHAWLQVLHGEVAVGSNELKPGDGAAISDERAASIIGRSDAEIMLFDLD